MFDALDIMFKKMNADFKYKNKTNEIPTIDIQKEYLNTLRKIA